MVLQKCNLYAKNIEESPDFKFSFSVYSISFHCKNNENESEQLWSGVLIYTQIFGYSVEVGGPTYDVECMILDIGIWDRDTHLVLVPDVLCPFAPTVLGL